MANLTVSDDVFQKLSERAAALRVSVDDLVKPALERLVERESGLPEPWTPLSGAAWAAELDAWRRAAESRAGRYPPDFVLDDSRETIYGEPGRGGLDPSRHEHPGPTSEDR